ncbi:MAG TPA: hypothetical protein PKE00_04895 [Planctomycetota bacterium]|nr:hypothetical protein [Planctomycetota bacterium]
MNLYDVRTRTLSLLTLTCTLALGDAGLAAQARGMPARAAVTRPAPARTAARAVSNRGQSVVAGALDNSASRDVPGCPGGRVATEPPSPELTARKAAMAFRSTRVEGRELAKRVDTVRKSVDWHKSLKAATAAARNEGKPILWIQTLGSLSGFL